VIYRLTVHVSFGIWRNLADTSRCTAPDLADSSGILALRQTVVTSGLRPQQCDGLRRLGCTDGRDCGGAQERQAAENRVDRQSEPGRRGQGKRRHHRHQPNNRRDENHSSQHVLQPPREEHCQGAGSAWQDCGRAWVNLRQVELRESRCWVDTERRPEGLVVTSIPHMHEQSLVARRRLDGGGGAQWPERRRPGSRNSAAGDGCVGRGHGALDAAIWRKINAVIWHRGPDVTEERLSFVMPQQHGVRGTEIGDGS
jgi:hypothetical protein